MSSSGSHGCTSSPRTRGCFWEQMIFQRHDVVFPAHAGVFPVHRHQRPKQQSLPRARGGVSGKSIASRRQRRSSPRTRGCFSGTSISSACSGVFPAHAGGVSCFFHSIWFSLLSSPRARGCFQRARLDNCLWRVFPAHAGVFLLIQYTCPFHSGLPRARGGGSGFVFLDFNCIESSPRTRGWFRDGILLDEERLVFPAHAGVFLIDVIHAIRRAGLPRTRGGVSCTLRVVAVPPESSPRTRGCFLLCSHTGSYQPVFPAHAGVFLAVFIRRHVIDRLPRARGDVS